MNTRAPAVTAGTAVYAIGDVHGRADLLSELLARAWTRNMSKVQSMAQVAWDWLQELNEGLIALSGARHMRVLSREKLQTLAS